MIAGLVGANDIDLAKTGKGSIVKLSGSEFDWVPEKLSHLLALQVYSVTRQVQAYNGVGDVSQTIDSDGMVKALRSPIGLTALSKGMPNAKPFLELTQDVLGQAIAALKNASINGVGPGSKLGWHNKSPL